MTSPEDYDVEVEKFDDLEEIEVRFTLDDEDGDIIFMYDFKPTLKRVFFPWQDDVAQEQPNGTFIYGKAVGILEELLIIAEEQADEQLRSKTVKTN